jgi:cytochrome c biogenesis protein
VDRVIFGREGQPQPLGFKVKLDKFNVSFYPSGAPREFKSTVTILEGTHKVFTEPILVNHPLTYKGISLYQSSYGIAGVEKAVLTIKDRESGEIVSIAAPMGKRTEVPGSSSFFLLEHFLPDLQGMGPTLQIIFFEPHRPQQEFWVFQNHPEFEDQRPGRYRLTIKEIEPRFYSSLQVTKDPGVWIVWIGCFLMVAGFYMTFFMSHRRIWVKLTEKVGGTLIEVTGSSHRDRLGFEKEFEKIYQALQGTDAEGKD